MAWLRRRAASASMRASEALSRHAVYRLRVQGAGAAAWARRRAAILSMRAASMPAPKPLSTLTVHTPGEHDVSAASSGVRPCRVQARTPFTSLTVLAKGGRAPATHLCTFAHTDTRAW